MDSDGWRRMIQQALIFLIFSRAFTVFVWSCRKLPYFSCIAITVGMTAWILYNMVGCWEWKIDHVTRWIPLTLTYRYIRMRHSATPLRRLFSLWGSPRTLDPWLRCPLCKVEGVYRGATRCAASTLYTTVSATNMCKHGQAFVGCF